MSKNKSHLEIYHTEKESLSRVAFLCNNDISYIVSQWATWISGQIGNLKIAQILFHFFKINCFQNILLPYLFLNSPHFKTIIIKIKYKAVPLCKAHPAELLEFYIKDSQSNLIVATPDFEEKLRPVAEKLNKPLKIIEQSALIDQESISVDEDTIIDSIPNGSFYKKSPAMMVYTSGTTSRPKGVLISYSNLEAQISSLVHAWNMQPTDTVLHSLPLHHVHGIINALLVPLSAGGKF